jgi:UDP-glucose 4-epimerase
MNNIKYSTVLITGGCGFIGSYIVDELVVQSCKVIVFDNYSTGNYKNANAIYIQGDINKSNDYSKLPIGIEYVIHLAAVISVTESILNPSKYHNTNVVGSYKLLRWCRQNKIKMFVSASSAAVYGNINIPATENMIYGGISPYAQSKYDMENIQQIEYNNHGFKSTILRLFNVYGSRQKVDSPYSGVISIFNKNAKNNEDITIYGNGKQIRDFIYVKDVVTAFINALKYPNGYSIYNIGTCNATSIYKLSQILLLKHNSTSIIKYESDKEGNIEYSLANIEKSSEIMFKPDYLLYEGLYEL